MALTSRNEGSPVSLIEAMAAGRPVVATRIGGVPDLVEDGVNGYLVEPGQPAAIAEALLALLEDPGRRDALGTPGGSACIPRSPPPAWCGTSTRCTVSYWIAMRNRKVADFLCVACGGGAGTSGGRRKAGG